MKLRHYQTDAITQTRQAIIEKCRKIIICMCTGAGKSPSAFAICQMASLKGNEVLYLTPSVLLTQQMKETLKELDNVIVETLQSSKNNEHDDIKIIILDEFHWAVNSKLQDEVLAKYPEAIVIGLSATPITHQGYKIDGWDRTLDIVQLCDLIEWGYACPIRVLAPASVDTSNFKSSGGDFNGKDVAEEVTKSSIVANIVDKYVKYGENRKAVVYAINVQHSILLTQDFIQRGITAEAYHSKINKNGRAEMMERFKTDYTHILVNVATLVTGFDYPRVYCLVLACPTKSIIKAVQSYGRGTRLNDSLDKKIREVNSKKVVFIPRHAFETKIIKDQLIEKGLTHILVQDSAINGYENFFNVFPNNPSKDLLILDCASVIKNTVHPMQRLDFDRENKKLKKCSCGGTFKIIKTELIENTPPIFLKRTTFKCGDCGTLEVLEKDFIEELTFCEECEEVIESGTSSIVMETKKDKIEMISTCPHCGHEKVVRSVKAIDSELEELEYFKKNNVIADDIESWEDVALQLKKAKNKDGKKYHWKWVNRTIKSLQNEGFMIDEVKRFIKHYLNSGYTIGGISQGMSKRRSEGRML